MSKRQALAAFLLTSFLVVGAPLAGDPSGTVSNALSELGMGTEEAAAFEDSDGCTLALDKLPWTFNFYDSCVGHDECYVKHLKSQIACDWEFYQDMVDSCGGFWIFFDSSCEIIACIYYNAVRHYGEYSYQHKSIKTPISYVIRKTAELVGSNPYGDIEKVLTQIVAKYGEDFWGTTAKLANYFFSCDDNPLIQRFRWDGRIIA